MLGVLPEDVCDSYCYRAGFTHRARRVRGVGLKRGVTWSIVGKKRTYHMTVTDNGNGMGQAERASNIP